MRLLTIGRDPQSSIAFPSNPYVSSYHAELIQLDNGEMYLVDKSTNGTFINGQRLVPGKEYPVKQGEAIQFADAPLDWSRVPSPVAPTDKKRIFNIGSHYANDIKINGTGVSRFHASIYQKTNKKWYIQDVSTNGTTVNGRQIQKNTEVEIRKKDTISCAGVTIKNPVSSGPSIGLIVGVCAASLLLLFGIGFGVFKMSGGKNYTDEQLCQKYQNAVGCLICYYHFEVSCPGLDLSELPDPDYKYKRTVATSFTMDGTPFDGDNGEVALGTGFVIGDQGFVATNRHVAQPWEIYKNENETYLQIAELYYRQKLFKLSKYYKNIVPYMNQVTVKGVLDNVYYVQNGLYLNVNTATNCKLVAVAQNEEEDVALFKLMTTEPVRNYVPVKCIDKTDPKQGSHIMTLGFPHGLSLQDNKLPLKALFAGGSVSKIYNDYMFNYTASTSSGASGSPIFDKKGKLVGIVMAKVPGSDSYNFAIGSKYLLKLLDNVNQ